MADPSLPGGAGARSEGGHDDLRAAVGARRDLGPDYEDAVLDSFLERLEHSIAARVDARLEERAGRLPRGRAPGADDDPSSRAFVLGVVSLGTGIPISAISGGTSGVAGLVVAWLGIVGVNMAHALARRRS